MSQHTPHELAEEFPDHKERIHELKAEDSHFAALAEEYHKVNRDLHRMETDIEPVSEQTEHELRKRRLQLKDEIAGYLR
jgi:hypothetical protein